MKKSKVTRSLLAACSIVALSAVMYGCVHSSDDPPATDDTTMDTPDPAIAERAAIKTAIDMASTAVAAVDNDSTDAEVSAADAAVAAARKAITDAANVPDEEKAANTGTVDALASRLTAAKSARTDAMDDARRAADMAMAATAAKLYAGIKTQADDATGTTTDDVFAAYNTAETAIEVTIGTGTAAGTAVTLSEDKDSTVAANHGWAGKRYADPVGGDMYEAVVYSNVEAPTQGKKFGGAAANDEYEYALTDGALPAASIVAANVALTGVTRTAGTETFKLPDPNPGEATVINVPGSYHGVSGTYNCDTTDGTSTCTAAVAATGFTLGGTGTWSFTPTNAEARVMDSADTAYASYGWWIKKAENDGPFTASAFVDFKGTAGDVDIADLAAGTATYVGGAAGKYALASSTGGTNDAGHFTARATLEADFEDDMITGTIDNFMGADGQSRNWSVALKKSGVSNTGAILGSDGTGDPMKTVWTIGDDAAAESGQWSGNLREEGDDGVPKVATGTFYSEYGTAGKMVGAFGANKQ